MLTPYPLEPPPPLPPFDGPWEGSDAPLLPGRRVRLEGERRAFGAGIGIGTIRCGGGVATRELIALEEPCVLWEGRAEGEISLDAALRFPDPDARVERSGDGTRLWLGGPATRSELLVGALGGTVEVVEGPSGPHLRARGNGALRLIVIAAEDEADRGRTLRTLARKGLAGLRAQRLRHAEQIDALALRTTGRDPGRDADLRALAHRLDAELTAVGGRYL
ncbi:MAG TPA: hypothetical protein VFI13_06255, partial [Gemmatimonadales bacterium]|nr:hypothetical protein [Gemmatimonadales bacterium]